MNYRLAIAEFPAGRADRILAALSESTGYSIEILQSRLDATPSWLLELPDREEAEAWKALLSRQRGVKALILPSVGRPVESLESALPRARLALGDRGGQSRPADRPSGGQSNRGIDLVASTGLGPPEVMHRESPRIPSASSDRPSGRGITAPVHFADDARSSGSMPVEPLADLSSPRRPSSLPPLSDSNLELDHRRRNVASPTVSPAGLRRKGMKVEKSFIQRVIVPLFRILAPIALVIGAVFGWKAINKPVLNKPDSAGVVELLAEGRLPLAVLRMGVLEQEDFVVALSLEHRFATRQIEARPRIDAVGGQGRLVLEDQAEDIFDVRPSGKESSLGRLRLDTVRVLDRGITGVLPDPRESGVDDEDRPAMRAFSRLIQPPYIQFPAEPVGTGARWRYRLAADQNPLDLDMIFEFELLSRDGDQVELRVKATVPSTRDPGEGAISYQRIGPFFVRYDPPVRVFDFAGVGEGHATLDLTRMTPLKFDVAIQFASRIEANTDFGRQLIDYAPVISLKVEAD